MFSRISFGGRSQPETFRLLLDFSSADASPASPSTEEADAAAGGQGRLAVEWTVAETDAEVLARVEAALHDPQLVQETVRLHLTYASQSLLGGVIAAASFGRDVSVGLSIHTAKPVLRSVELTRTSGSSAVVSTSLGLAIWSLLDVSHVTRLRVDEGAGASVWDERVLASFTCLHELNASHSGLLALPASIRVLAGTLEELRLHHNRLKLLPPEVGQLTRLRALAADSNEISILPGELRFCSRLEELTLENNRLASVLLNFACLPRLQVLHLYNNPLEFLPEISPCHELRHLSVANMRVTADHGFTKFKVELLPLSTSSSLAFFDSKHTDKLRPIFALMLRRSSGHHPLLAGALYSLAEEDPKNRELMAKQESGLTQLVLLALHDNPAVVVWACATLTLLAKHSPELAEAVVDNDLASVLDYIHPPRPRSPLKSTALPPQPLGSSDAQAEHQRLQLCSLQVLSAVAHTSPAASAKLLSPRLLSSLISIVGNPQAEDPLRAAALEALGNLAWHPDSRRLISEQDELMRTLDGLVGPSCLGLKLKTAATRVLAVLGENERVRQAVGRPPITGRRGVRVLSMDGGGMKGMAAVRMLRQLEQRTGRHISDLFDLIVGTSTGGLLAVALGLRRMSMDDCDHIYKVLGRKVFTRPLAPTDKQESWMESFYRTLSNKTQHVRAVVVGSRHDTRVYEALLQEYADCTKENRFIGESMIDTACLDAPKIALVSTIASVTPAQPFVFRNYELPPEAEELRRQLLAHEGSSKHAVWQAVRASSAAATYLDAFSHNGDRFQDGAVTANNPAVIALQEARLLWPDVPIECVVSIGTGSSPPKRRSAALSTFMETGSILIESSTTVERQAEALAALLPLVPGLKYFRFNPHDPRCEMELDEINPAEWEKLEAATDDYIAQAAAQFEEAAAALLQGLEEEPYEGSARRQHSRRHSGTLAVTPAAAAAAAQPGSSVRLGRRRRLVVVHAPVPQPAGQAGPAGQQAHAQTAVEAVTAACMRMPECLEVLDLQAAAGSVSSSGDGLQAALGSPPAAGGAAAGPGSSRPTDDTASQPAAAAVAGGAQLGTGAAAEGPPTSEGAQAEEPADGRGSSLGSYLSSWFGSPAKEPPPLASHPLPLAADGGIATEAASADKASSAQQEEQEQLQQQQQQQQQQQRQQKHPEFIASSSSSGETQPPEPLQLLRQQLEATADAAGLVFLGLEPCPGGLALCWRQWVQAVVEPGEQAAALLDSVRAAGLQASSLSNLFDQQPSLQLPGTASGCPPRLSLLSRHTQYVGGQRLSVLLLQLTEPAAALVPGNVQQLGSALEGRVVASAAPLPTELVHALLHKGRARAVLCPSGQTSAAAAACLGTACAAMLSGCAAGEALRRANAQQQQQQHQGQQEEREGEGVTPPPCLVLSVP